MRPRVRADVVAALAGQVPARIAKKLDANPRMAEGWRWSDDGRTVRTSGEETVALAPREGVVQGVEDVRCSCLLSPRCLHVLAVVTCLEVDEGAPSKVEGTATAAGAPPPVAEVTPAQRRAAEHAFEAGAELVESGAGAAGVVLQGALLRAAHGCRVAGLHRLSACGLRVAAAVRALRAERAEFESAALFHEVCEWMSVAWELKAAVRARPFSPPDLAALIGVARRRFEPAGHLTLTGVFTEPVVTGSGYSGVATMLVDEGGHLYSLSDVQPGDESRLGGAYRGAAKLGGGAVTHFDLCRSLLHVEGATASADGRLGAGAGVKAVAAGRAGWDAPAVAAHFRRPLAEQLERGRLLFVEAQVLGRMGGELALVHGDGTEARVVISALAPLQHESVAAADNLELLARLPGLRARFVLRSLGERRRSAHLLAVGVAGGAVANGPALALPESWMGTVNIGLDRLQGAHCMGASERPVEVAAPKDDYPSPLAAFRRRLARLVMGGRLTLEGPAHDAAAREAQRLAERHLMPEAGRCLEALAAAAQQRPNEPFDVGRLGAAFVAAAVYLEAAERTLERSAWLA